MRTHQEGRAPFVCGSILSGYMVTRKKKTSTSGCLRERRSSFFFEKGERDFWVLQCVKEEAANNVRNGEKQAELSKKQ